MRFFRQNRHFSQRDSGIDIIVIYLQPHFASAMSYEQPDFTIVISNRRVAKNIGLLQNEKEKFR